MFETLRAIGRDDGPRPDDEQKSRSDTLHVPAQEGSAGTDTWVARQLRCIQRHYSAVRAHMEQHADNERIRHTKMEEAEEQQGQNVTENFTPVPLNLSRQIFSQLCAAYEKPLTALHVTTAASLAYLVRLSSSTPSAASLRQDTIDAVVLKGLFDALPSAIVWGMAANLWHTADDTGCSNLRRLAATAQQQDPSCVEVNSQTAQQLLLSSTFHAKLTDELVSLRDAQRRALKTTQSAHKRPRETATPLGTQHCSRTNEIVRAVTAPQDARCSVDAVQSVGSSVTLPLRSTAARAQAAEASRSRSRTPPPSRSRSRSPPPPPSPPAHTSLSTGADAATAAPVGKKATAESTSTASPFSFGVRVAGKQNKNNDERKKNSSTYGTNGIHPTNVRPVDDIPHFASPAPLPSAQTLRQTTLAAFTSPSSGGGTIPIPQPQQSAPAAARATKQADVTQNTNPTPFQRQSWHNPPPLPDPSKAPPYQYDLRGNGGSNNNEGRGDGPFYNSRSSPAPAVGSNNITNKSTGGFVTAAEQLVSDIKQGRTMSSAYLSKRSPALGLRRTGFQPPFRDQSQQQQRQQQPGTATDGQESVRGVAPHMCSPSNTNKGVTGTPLNARPAATNDNNDEDGSTYPACLLLPDGSVPPILAPLDPKLVTQVAMEILDNGAGAKQVGWDDIAGLQHAKASVEEAIVWPLRRPDLFVGLRDPPRGLLLFGPPGTGKTMIARAIANRAGCTFLNISSSSLMSKWLGDGEKLVRCLFAVATVRQPSVIFIDEIDSLLSTRGEGEMDSVRRVKTEFLVQLDGVATDGGDRVLLIGATNRPDELDEAARRRMEKRLYIPLPDEAARRELIQRLLRSLGPNGADAEEKDADNNNNTKNSTTHAAVVHTLTDADLDSLVRSTHGYSGADLKQLCREAAMGPLREMSVGQLSEVSVCDVRPIQRRDFKQALKRLKPSVGPAEVNRYVEWNRLFGSFNDQDNESDEDDVDSTDDADN